MALLLAGATLAAYAPSLRGPFIYDDRVQIVDNAGLRDPLDLGALRRSVYQENRPLILFAFAVARRIGGGSPLPFRLISLALHLLAAYLLFCLARRARADLLARRADDPPGASRRSGHGPPLRWLPPAAALLFALHPLASESVAYISAQAGLFAAVLSLLSVLLYLHAVRCDSRGRRALAHAGSLICLALGVLAKESAAVTPLLTLSYLALLRPAGARGSFARQALPLLGHLALAGALAALLLATARYPHGRTFGLALMPWGDHALTQLRVLARALSLFVFPARLNFDYHIVPSTSPADWRVLASAAALAALGYAAWRLRHRAPLAALASLWFLVGLAPTNSVVQFRDLLAERHLYVPLAGFALLAGWAATAWADRLRRTTPRLLALPLIAWVVFVLDGGVLTFARSSMLADPPRLWADTVEKSPGKARPHLNFGIALLERGHAARGRAHLERALALDPRLAAAHYNLAVFHERHGDLHRALSGFRRAVTLRATRAHLHALARAANRLGAARYAAGDLAGAARLFEEARRSDDAWASPCFNLALTRLAQGQRGEALALLRQTLTRDPAHAKARARLRALGAR